MKQPKHYDRSLIKLAMKNGAHTIGRGEKFVNGEPTGAEALVFTVPQKMSLSALGLATAFPKKIDGIFTDVVQGDMPRAYQDPTGKFRPCPAGVSVGHYNITAGTLGCWVTLNGVKVMLSNNHVLADSNEAAIDDEILQPGPYDGGDPDRDLIAKLLYFEPIHFLGEQSGCKYSQMEKAVLNARNALLGRGTRYDIIVPEADYNLVDCAVAKPLYQADVKDEILNIGKINGMISGQLGMPARKMGRTTGYQEGTVTQVDVLTEVSYGAGKIAVFEDQLLIEPGGFSAGGDSGSAILDDRNRLFGLLFAGSDTVTIACRIENVQDAIGFTM